MGTGAVHLDAHGLDELLKLAKSRDSSAAILKDFRDTNVHVAWIAQQRAQRDAPVGHRSKKDGRGHAAPGYLREHIKRNVSQAQAGISVTVPTSKAPLILDEFGGTSLWHSGGAGGIRTYRHENAEKAAKRAKVRYHKVYDRPRKELGNFLWNVAFRERRKLTAAYQEGIKRACKKHGIAIDMAHGDLDFISTPPGRVRHG